MSSHQGSAPDTLTLQPTTYRPSPTLSGRQELCSGRSLNQPNALACLRRALEIEGEFALPSRSRFNNHDWVRPSTGERPTVTTRILQTLLS